jgi:hypothetical protein
VKFFRTQICAANTVAVVAYQQVKEILEEVEAGCLFVSLMELLVASDTRLTSRRFRADLPSWCRDERAGIAGVRVV